MINIKNNIITITVDEEELKDYNKYYFHKYPKRRKAPIEKPMHPSINQWMIMKRPQMNDVKQKWKEFIIWLIKKYELQNKKIEKCNITYVLTFPTKLRRDLDNYSMKFLNDGLVESQLLVDDSYFNVIEAKYKGRYEKGIYKMDVIIEILD